MKRRRLLLLLALVAAMALALAFWPRGPREPVYRGKGLMQWVKEADNADTEHPATEARAALIAIGTNAVPYLLHNYTRPISEWRLRFNAWARNHPSIKVRFRDDRVLINNAGLGLMHLRTNAAPAIPVVMRYLDDPDRVWSARMIFYWAGDASVSHLVAAAASTNITTTSNALVALGMLIHAKSPASDTIIGALRHSNSTIRQKAVGILGRSCGPEANYVPQIASAATDPDPRVSKEATDQLNRLTVQGVPEVRTAAVTALHKLQTNAPPEILR